MNNFKVILLMLLCALGVKCDCRLSRHMVEGTNRIFIYRDDSGAYQLLRTELVPSGLMLYMFCNAGDVVETQCQDNGQFSVSLPMSCGNPMKPTVFQIRDAACSERLYAVGHIIEGKQLELYRCCYDTNNGRVVYSESDVYYKTFFAKRPFVDFETDQIVTPAEAAAYMKGNIYEAFQCVFGKQQNYLPNSRSLIINRGHLVASADFLFIDQMSSTFRYLNIVPQFKSINDGNWEKIERWIRDKVSNSAQFRIKTGGINVLTLRDENGRYQSACLSGSKVPVPEWIYKVVRDINGKAIYVFLSFNNTFERQRPVVIAMCQPVACPFWLADNPDDGFIFCCDPANFPY